MSRIILICWGLSLSFSFSVSLNPPPRRSPLHIHSLFSTACGLCLFDAHQFKDDKKDVADIKICFCFIGRTWNVCFVCTLQHFCKYTNSLFLCCVCAQLFGIKVHLESWLKPCDPVVPVWDGGGCNSSGLSYCLRASFQLFTFLKVVFVTRWDTNPRF